MRENHLLVSSSSVTINSFGSLIKTSGNGSGSLTQSMYLYRGYTFIKGCKPTICRVSNERNSSANPNVAGSIPGLVSNRGHGL